MVVDEIKFTPGNNRGRVLTLKSGTKPFRGFAEPMTPLTSQG